MVPVVETLEKLERKMTLNLPIETVESEVFARLKKLARTVKMDGFRPGKVSMNVVAQRHGHAVHYEVINEMVGNAFFSAATEAKLHVAGEPSINEKDGAAQGQYTFEAVFEVYPEVKMGDLASAEIEKVSASVSDAAIDKTIGILRKQRRTFAQRAHNASAETGDRVTVDFEGKIDGEAFEGGSAKEFQFILGDGQMLKEFEVATLGLKIAESKTFPLTFPTDYHGKDVAGKTADFMVTVKKIEAAHLPEVNEALAKSLGIADASVEGLRADIKKNLEREVNFRVLSRNKSAVMDALIAKAEFDLPKATIQSEMAHLLEAARADLKKRGIKDADKIAIPDDVFRPQAERRVRLGLVVSELVRAHNLQATPAQIKAHIEDMSASYENPAEVVHWYYSDKSRLAEIETVVLENNVTNFVLSQAKVTEKTLDFDELMAQK